MIFKDTQLVGAYLVEPELREDERGFFARSWCRDEFQAHGINSKLVQSNISWNARRGTLRGMHFQLAPRAEAKLVRCTRGAIYDVLIDLRTHSGTYLSWIAVELNADNRHALYVPEGVAHGFQTLVDDTEVLYFMSEFYAPELARGVRWNDPSFGIEWPILNPILSARDKSYPDLQP